MVKGCEVQDQQRKAMQTWEGFARLSMDERWAEKQALDPTTMEER